MFKKHRITHYDTDTLAKTKDNRENVEATPRGCPNLSRGCPDLLSRPHRTAPSLASMPVSPRHCRGLLRDPCLAVVGTTTLSFLRKQESRLFEL